MFKHGFPPEWSTLKKLIWLVGSGIAGAASGIWKTVTGTLLHLTDALPSPVKELSVAIEPQQSGSGDPSPTNIRPITGWTGCNVFAYGVNLFDGQMENGDINESTGQNSGTSSSRRRSTNYIPVKVKDGYISVYFHSPGRTGTVRVFFYKEDKSFYWFTTFNVNAVNTKSADDDVKYMRFRYSSGVVSGDTEISVNYPNTITKYVPYSGTTYPISWQTEAGTIYGGTLTINQDGSVDLVSSLANIASYNGEAINEPWLSSIDKYVSGATPTTGAQVVYTLAEPVTYHLDSIEQISTLAGENNIWADVNGEITLTYQAVPQTAFSDNADTGMADYMTLTE